MSRSGTLTYQIGNELAQRGFGNSSIVGIGGDPVPGTSFIDVIAAFEADRETELIVMAGEIGGSAEEEAADYIAEHVAKPVVAYIAGFTAPPGKTMGHAGAIVSGTAGTAKAKQEALEARGVRVGQTPTEVAEIAARDRGTRSATLSEPATSRSGGAAPAACRSASAVPGPVRRRRRRLRRSSPGGSGIGGAVVARRSSASQERAEVASGDPRGERDEVGGASPRRRGDLRTHARSSRSNAASPISSRSAYRTSAPP